MLWHKQRLKIAVVACFVALTLATNDFSFGSTQLHFVLEQIAPLLGKTGIDVFCCDAAQPRGERPRVGLLEDMPKTSFEQMPSVSFVSHSWEA